MAATAGPALAFGLVRLNGHVRLSGREGARRSQYALGDAARLQQLLPSAQLLTHFGR